MLSVLLSLVGDVLVIVYRSEGGNGELQGLLFGGDREQSRASKRLTLTQIWLLSLTQIWLSPVGGSWV